MTFHSANPPRPQPGPPEDKREFWWIASDHKAQWAGLRIAIFLPDFGGFEQGVMILGDMGDRIGVRIWSHIQRVEGWRKVRRIERPDDIEIRAAFL